MLQSRLGLLGSPWQRHFDQPPQRFFPAVPRHEQMVVMKRRDDIGADAGLGQSPRQLGR